MPRMHLHIAVSLLIGVGLLAPTAPAQSEVGTLASVVGQVEVQRGGGGDWQPAMVGAPLLPSDRIRTSTGAAAKLVFVDDSVTDLAESTQVEIEKYTIEPEASEHRSLLRLLAGKLEAMVDERYKQPQWRYEIETPTAIARVHGARFILSYDVAKEHTDAVGLEGSVEVQSALGVIEQGVEIGAGQFTRVQKGGFPTPARAVDAAALAQYREGLGTIGTGQRESLDVGHPLVVGRVLRPEDRAATVAGFAPPSTGAETEGSYLSPRPPGETLVDRLSPDVRAITQPVLEYEREPDR